jgi:hypothetical protein
MTDETKTQENPLAPYMATASETVAMFAARAQTDGDPEAFGATFANLLQSYLAPVLQVRALAAADAFVVLQLMETARMVSAGPQPQRFRDMLSAALQGAVHTERVFALHAERTEAERKAAPAANEPIPDVLVSMDPDSGLWPQTGTPMARVLDKDTGQQVGLYDRHGSLQPFPPHHDGGGAPVEDRWDDPQPEAVLGPDSSENYGDIERDEAALSDVDLRRFVLDPGADVWADLIDRPDWGKPTLRVGKTQEMVQARFDRVHAFLDAGRPAEVTEADWEAAKIRSLPMAYGKSTVGAIGDA